MTSDISWGYWTPEQLSDLDCAKGILAKLLRLGQIALFLGAGVSADMGFPEWKLLVQRCATELGDTGDYTGVNSAMDLMKAIDTLRRKHNLTKEQMMAVVRGALYGDPAKEPTAEHPFDVIDSRLLTALGALMMSSARGSAGEVFTLNFDDVLEWYLDLHGFQSEVVCELPMLLRGDVDVHVFHIHGFLPLMKDRYETSSWMVFSESELEDRLAKEATYPWEALVLNRLQSKMLLVVGTSMSDTDVKVSLARARATVADRPLGFVLGEHTEDKIAELREKGLVPLTFADKAEIPQFLLEICQIASKS